MPLAIHGWFPGILPFFVDFVVYSNEDIGLTAALVAGTNDVYSFAYPYPATLDLFRESMLLWALEFIFQSPFAMRGAATSEGLMVHMSMLDREFDSSWYGTLDDANDEAMKAQFAGPFYFGHAGVNPTTTVAIEGSYRPNDAVINATYLPPGGPLDLTSPLIIQFTTSSSTVTLATNAVAEKDFTLIERIALRGWFTRRLLTRDEQMNRNQSVRFQRLDS